MRESLDPTLGERLQRLLRPDFTRTVAARRIAAGVLVLLAAASAFRPDAAGTYTDVVVAAADLHPGEILAADDVRLERRWAATVPDGALTRLDQVVGSAPAGPARRGEVMTDARVLGSRLAGLSAGHGARLVPVHLADTGVLDVIRTGDVVDVLGAPAAEPEARPQVLAAGAVVVLVSSPATGPGAGGDRVLLVALPGPAAVAVAGAGLSQTVTLTIH